MSMNSMNFQEHNDQGMPNEKIKTKWKVYYSILPIRSRFHA
jgi:hypothetical protein